MLLDELLLLQRKSRFIDLTGSLNMGVHPLVRAIIGIIRMDEQPRLRPVMANAARNGADYFTYEHYIFSGD